LELRLNHYKGKFLLNWIYIYFYLII
jgi:hypothetical protein